jgi:hypothetical protein
VSGLDRNAQELRQVLDVSKLGGRDGRIGTRQFPRPSDIAAMQTLGLQTADAPVGRELPEPAHLGIGDDAVIQDTIQKAQVRYGGSVRPVERDANGSV